MAICYSALWMSASGHGCISGQYGSMVDIGSRSSLASTSWLIPLLSRAETQKSRLRRTHDGR